jgi:hypothetical protein
MELSEDQYGVAKGMAAAAIASLVVWAGPVLFLAPPAILDEPAQRLAYTLPWQLLPLSTLVLGIAWLARYRFFNALTIHGGNPDHDQELQAGRAYLQNTVEQIVLVFITSMILAIVLPLDWLQGLPVLAGWFTFCRLLFRISYLRGAPARAFGFGGTFYPVVIGMAFAGWFAITA